MLSSSAGNHHQPDSDAHDGQDAGSFEALRKRDEGRQQVISAPGFRSPCKRLVRRDRSWRARGQARHAPSLVCLARGRHGQ